MFPRWYRILFILWLLAIPLWWIGAPFAGTTFFKPAIVHPNAFDGAFIYTVIEIVFFGILFLTPLLAPVLLFAKRKETSK